MIKKLCAGVALLVSIFSAIMFAGVPNVANWWNIAWPYFAVCFIAMATAMMLTFPNAIRQVLYSIFVCMCAWAYKHKIIRTKFAKSAYKIYKMNHSSYSELYAYTKVLFVIYIEGLADN